MCGLINRELKEKKNQKTRLQRVGRKSNFQLGISRPSRKRQCLCMEVWLTHCAAFCFFFFFFLPNEAKLSLPFTSITITESCPDEKHQQQTSATCPVHQRCEIITPQSQTDKTHRRVRWNASDTKTHRCVRAEPSWPLRSGPRQSIFCLSWWTQGHASSALCPQPHPHHPLLPQPISPLHVYWDHPTRHHLSRFVLTTQDSTCSDYGSNLSWGSCKNWFLKDSLKGFCASLPLSLSFSLSLFPATLSSLLSAGP